MSSFSSIVTKITNHPWVFYIVILLAFITLIGYWSIKNYTAMIFFGIITFLVTQFYHTKSNQWVIALLLAIIITNLFVAHRPELREGMTNAEKNVKKEKVTKKVQVKKAQMNQKQANDVQDSDSSNIEEDTTEENETTDDPQPNSSTTPPESMNTMGNKKHARIDYASTVESAYGNLSDILGGDGIKNLTSDTQKLMGQQQQLAEAMKGMTPLLETAKSMLDGFDMKHLNGLAELTKNFSSVK